MKFLQALAVAAFGLTLGQCNQQAPRDQRAPTGPSPYAFDIMLEITPEASELMKAKNTHFVAAVLYFGRPKPDVQAPGNRILNRVRLGYETVGVAKGAIKVHIPGAALDTGLLGNINGEPHAMVTIYSTAADNIRDDLVRCKTYYGIISSARANTPTVECDLVRP